MRISIDRKLCSGHARCFATAPEVFDLDDDGFGIVRYDDDLPPELEERGQRAAANCPERAITVDP
jgi:ferredoxin